MSLFTHTNSTEVCDICGTPLDPDDIPIHLCKYCQSMQYEDEH